MKHLASICCVLLTALLIMISIQLDKSNKEIIDLNNQVSALEIQAGKDSDLINELKKKIKRRSHNKKKVVCIDLSTF